MKFYTLLLVKNVWTKRLCWYPRYAIHSHSWYFVHFFTFDDILSHHMCFVYFLDSFFFSWYFLSQVKFHLICILFVSHLFDEILFICTESERIIAQRKWWDMAPFLRSCHFFISKIAHLHIFAKSFLFFWLFSMILLYFKFVRVVCLSLNVFYQIVWLLMLLTFDLKTFEFVI